MDRPGDSGDHLEFERVNLTDGLDGLAAGSGTFCFGVLAIIATGNSVTSRSTTCTPRWTSDWSASSGRGMSRLPLVERGAARIIMGDTGSSR